MEKALLFFLALALITIPAAANAQEKDKDWRSKSEKSWSDFKAEALDYFPSRIEKMKEMAKRLKIAPRPETELSAFPDNPELWQAATTFYNFIKGRELDVAAEQSGIPGFFPSRAKYYEFLDTILPAMRDRKFERNRMLEYKIHEIVKLAPEGEEETFEFLVSATSDDTLPFGKLMVFRHKWHKAAAGWYPGKVLAEPATYWERIR